MQYFKEKVLSSVQCMLYSVQMFCQAGVQQPAKPLPYQLRCSVWRGTSSCHYCLCTGPHLRYMGPPAPLLHQSSPISALFYPAQIDGSCYMYTAPYRSKAADPSGYQAAALCTCCTAPAVNSVSVCCTVYRCLPGRYPASCQTFAIPVAVFSLGRHILSPSSPPHWAAPP
jgi:hypothetical protein